MFGFASGSLKKHPNYGLKVGLYRSFSDFFCPSLFTRSQLPTRQVNFILTHVPVSPFQPWRGLKDVPKYSSKVNVSWEKAINNLKNHPNPNVTTYTSTISVCAKARQWEKALELLEEMQERKLVPNIVTYTSTISACAKGRQWKKALELLEEMQERKLVPDVITYSSTISACEKGGQWKKALELLEEMQERKLVPNVITYNSTISACEKGRQWKKALELLEEMQERKLVPNVITYTAVIGALDSSKQFVPLMNVFEQGTQNCVFDHVFVSQKKVDLHGCSVPVAHAVLRFVIQEWRFGVREVEDLLVITGQGKHSPGASVLPQSVRAFVENEGLQISEVDGNPGRFVLRADAIDCWLGH